MKLKEEFTDYIKNNYEKEPTPHAVYKNPTHKEVKSILKEEKVRTFVDNKNQNKYCYFRVLINENKKIIYLFNESLLHKTVKIALYNDNKINHEIYYNLLEDFLIYNITEDTFEEINYLKEYSFINTFIDNYNKKTLKEEFADYIKQNNVTFGMYINPTKTELKQLIKEENIMPEDFKRDEKWKKFYSLRFIADKITKKIFVFNYNFLHEDAIKYLIKNSFIKEDIHENVLKSILNYSKEDDIFDTYSFGIPGWEFLDKYINKLNNVQKTIKEEFEDYYGNGNFIYKNPAKNELKKMFKEEQFRIINKNYYGLRFIADSATKNIFVFNQDVLHSKILKKLKEKENLKNENLMLHVFLYDFKNDKLYYWKRYSLNGELIYKHPPLDEKFKFVKEYMNRINK